MNAAGGNFLYIKYFETPLGHMVAGATDKGLTLLEFVDGRLTPTEWNILEKRFRLPLKEASHTTLEMAMGEVRAYFTGSLKNFKTLLQLQGTPFQKQVWNSLIEIPYGSTISYKKLSDRIGNPYATRAVARANGKNPIAILVPCHRVIGENRSMTGYAGGIWRKRKLLELEISNSNSDKGLFGL